MKRKLIISPCGTSLLTNFVNQELRKKINKYANYKEQEIDLEDKTIIEQEINKLSAICLQWDLEEAQRRSAELNSLIKFYHGKLSEHNDHHILIKTDTYLGSQTAIIIQKFLKRYNFSVEILEIKDLQTKDMTSFHLALSEIVKDFDERLPFYQKQNYEIVFNLTGGFKSIQGFLQVLAMFYADKSIYIFESNEELLEIPKIPIKLDRIDIFESNLNAFRNLEIGNKIDGNNIPDIFLFRIGDEVTLSSWGELAWKNAKDTIYEKKLFDPPTNNIKYSKNFVKKAEKLQPNRIKELNKKIDDLAKYLLKGVNPASLNFKKIEGSPKENSTHEFYINSDEAKRGFCHFDDNGNLVIDEYGDHL